TPNRLVRSSEPASSRPWVLLWIAGSCTVAAALSARYRTPRHGIRRSRDRSPHQRFDLLPHRLAHLLAEGAGEVVAVAEHRSAADHRGAGLGVAEVAGEVHAVHLVAGLVDRRVLGRQQVLAERLLAGDGAGRGVLEMHREALVRA